MSRTDQLLGFGHSVLQVVLRRRGTQCPRGSLRPGGCALACALMEGGALAGQLVNPLTVLFISHQGVLQRDHSSDSTLPQLPKKEILTFPLEGKGGRETKDLISGLKSTEG